MEISNFPKSSPSFLAFLSNASPQNRQKDVVTNTSDRFDLVSSAVQLAVGDEVGGVFILVSSGDADHRQPITG